MGTLPPRSTKKCSVLRSDVLLPWSRLHTMSTGQKGLRRGFHWDDQGVDASQLHRATIAPSMIIPYLSCFNVVSSPRTNQTLQGGDVHMVSFSRPRCALFRQLTKCSPDGSLARRVESKFRPIAGTGACATFLSVTGIISPAAPVPFLIGRTLPYPAVRRNYYRQFQ